MDIYSWLINCVWLIISKQVTGGQTQTRTKNSLPSSELKLEFLMYIAWLVSCFFDNPKPLKNIKIYKLFYICYIHYIYNYM